MFNLVSTFKDKAVETSPSTHPLQSGYLEVVLDRTGEMVS